MEITSFFKSLADSTRLRILNLLRHHELNVNEIVSVMGMGQSRISRHLKILTDTGFLSSRRDGLWVFYHASATGKAGEFLQALTPVLSSDAELSGDLKNLEKVLDEGIKKKSRYFDSIAPEWDYMKNEILGGLEINREIVTRIHSCETAADIGCGTGELLDLLSERAARVIGVDNSPNMLAEAARRLGGLGDAVDLRLGSIEHLPMRDREMDAVVMNLVLHYVNRPAEAVIEAARVLRPGGIFIMADFDKHDREEMRAVYNHRWLGFGADEVRQWLRNAGFRVLEDRRFEVAKGLHLVLYRSEKSPGGGRDGG